MREFTEKEKKKEAFLRTSNALYSHWRVSTFAEKQSLQCGGSTRLFDHLVPNDYITLGESVKGKGHREHVVPCAMIREQGYKMFNNGYLVEDVASMIENNLIIIHITSEEQKFIDVELGYKRVMPDDWKFGDSAYARLDKAGIKIKYYKQI